MHLSIVQLTFFSELFKGVGVRPPLVHVYATDYFSKYTFPKRVKLWASSTTKSSISSSPSAVRKRNVLRSSSGYRPAVNCQHPRFSCDWRYGEFTLSSLYHCVLVSICRLSFLSFILFCHSCANKRGHNHHKPLMRPPHLASNRMHYLLIINISFYHRRLHLKTEDSFILMLLI